MNYLSSSPTNYQCFHTLCVHNICVLTRCIISFRFLAVARAAARLAVSNGECFPALSSRCFVLLWINRNGCKTSLAACGLSISCDGLRCDDVNFIQVVLRKVFVVPEGVCPSRIFIVYSSLSLAWRIRHVGPGF